MQLRKYQEEACFALREARQNGAHSALIVMATGLGKTVVSAFDVGRYMSHKKCRTLFLCHNNAILEQNMLMFQYILDGDYSYGLFNGFSRDLDADILFASFQMMLDHKEKFAPNAFDYIVVDEAHHAPAKTFKEVIDYFKPDFLVGMTATPHRFDGLELEEVFGPITYNLGLTEAIRRGLLVNIHYELMLDEMVNLDSIEVEGEKISISELNRRLFVPKRDEEIARIIKDKATELGTKNTLVFCRSIEHAEVMCKLLKGSRVVHSGKPAKENREIINDFRLGEISIIVSVDQLNEGIDIPHADLIVFLRSTVSPTIFYQQLGRGLRLHEGKEFATVLDFVGNYWRLEIINALAKEINYYGDAEKEDERFVLNISAPQFQHRKVDISTILERIDRLVYGWDDEELISQVQGLAQEFGRTPTAKEFNKDSRTTGTRTILNRFGTWNEFLEKADLKANFHRVTSEDDLIAQVQRLAKELGRTPTRKEFNSNPRTMSATTVYGHFHCSWNEFLEKAGLNVGFRRDLSDDELIAQAHRLAKKLGKTPTARDFDKDSETASVRTVLIRFGSWNEFLKIAGLKANSRRGISDDELIIQVQKLAQKLGRTPTAKDFDRDPETSSFTMAIGRFGSWNGFLEKAGLEINKRSKTEI